MEFKNLEIKSAFSQDKKITERIELFQKLINELKKKNIPEAMINSINIDIAEMNTFSGSDKDLVKLFRKKQTDILKMLEKEQKLVTKNHYRNQWLALGMSAFGIPIGVAIGISAGNLGLLGIGLPIGMGIGIAVGASMDKKAMESGKQLDVEMKH